MTTYIRTRLFKATDERGERVRAYCNGHQATVPYDYGLNPPEMHERAARAVLDALGIEGTIHPSQHTTPRGYVYEVES